MLEGAEFLHPWYCTRGKEYCHSVVCTWLIQILLCYEQPAYYTKRIGYTPNIYPHHSASIGFIISLIVIHFAPNVEDFTVIYVWITDRDTLHLQV